MANVLFVTWDGGGNVPPALGIAAALRQRGHRVRFLGHEQQRTTIEGAGFGFEAYVRAVPWSSAAPNPGLKAAFKIVSVFCDRGIGRDLIESLRREPADVVVIDCLLFGALEAAERAGLRRAVLVHTFYHYMLGTWSRSPLTLLARLRRQRPVGLWSAADLVLVTTLDELDPAARGPLPSSVHYTGPVWQGAPDVKRSVDQGQPLVLASLSTTYFDGQARALQSILDAVADLPVHALVTTGPSVDPASLSGPANAEVHRFLPHEDLMARVSLVVGHGGHATTMLALAHDLPLVIMPMHPMLDQPLIGRTVEAKGAARVVPKSASPDCIRAAIENLLGDAPHRQAAARLGAAIRRRDGAVEAADRLEALMSVATT